MLSEKKKGGLVPVLKVSIYTRSAKADIGRIFFAVFKFFAYQTTILTDDSYKAHKIDISGDTLFGIEILFHQLVVEFKKKKTGRKREVSANITSAVRHKLFLRTFPF